VPGGADGAGRQVERTVAAETLEVEKQAEEVKAVQVCACACVC
jgi:hypothetical protein